jgi:hypothetical protein
MVGVRLGLIALGRRLGREHRWFAKTEGQNRRHYQQKTLSNRHCITSRTKKADVAEHPEEFRHVGLLANEPPGTAGLLSI